MNAGAQKIRLIAGLGNPGREYAATRHNAGFQFLDRLAAQLKTQLKPESKFLGKTARVRSAGGDLILIAPQTFMNRSGQGVAALANFYRIAADEILVVHDELDLPPGSAKMKFGGGVAGHNGLKDIAMRLGTHDFWRLRVGIGHPGDKDVVADYVLEQARREERQLTDEAIDRGLEVFPQIADGNLEAAMLKLHTRR
jgi:PTH1 family peptidyl-tRNA hydrolase